MTLQSSPSNDQGGININTELKQVGVSNGPEYYNPNPWARYWVGQMKPKLKLMGK